MPNPTEYYSKEVEQHSAIAQRLKTQLTLLSVARIGVFLATAAATYFLYPNMEGLLSAVAIGVILFIILLTEYTNKKYKRDFHLALVDINQEELRIIDGDFQFKPNGAEYKNPSHFFSEDIDLFGNGSFFQYLDRTSSHDSRTFLAHELLANRTDQIGARQACITELSERTAWRQEFSAYARLVKVETNANDVINWVGNYKPIYKSYQQWLPIVFSLSSMVVFVLIYLDILSLSFLLYWLILGIGITSAFLKKINMLSAKADKARDTIRQYAVLLKHIESATFKTDLLKAKREQLTLSGKSAAKLFKQFSSALDTLDNRNNLIYALLGNGFFLTDIRNSFKVEKWIMEFGKNIPEWFSIISYFDAYNSFGAFAFNHPTYVYPELSTGQEIIYATHLGHPLIKPEKLVPNDLKMLSEQFFIITGANMAGKSTFLRTVSLHIVMANCGLPVCAKTSVYRPIKLITSMRTNDSLKDESSYFFSELSRLKFIVDAIKTEEYFIVLDEILKGTNSTDKAIGSRKFVQKLVEGNATGLIATHDLSLCEIADELEDVRNYYFDAEIINDELFFDYKFKKGICENMNASFLLRKMEII